MVSILRQPLQGTRQTPTTSQNSHKASLESQGTRSLNTSQGSGSKVSSLRASVKNILNMISDDDDDDDGKEETTSSKVTPAKSKMISILRQPLQGTKQTPTIRQDSHSLTYGSQRTRKAANTNQGSPGPSWPSGTNNILQLPISDDEDSAPNTLPPYRVAGNQHPHGTNRNPMASQGSQKVTLKAKTPTAKARVEVPYRRNENLEKPFSSAFDKPYTCSIPDSNLESLQSSMMAQLASFMQKVKNRVKNFPKTPRNTIPVPSASQPSSRIGTIWVSPRRQETSTSKSPPSTSTSLRNDQENFPETLPLENIDVNLPAARDVRVPEKPEISRSRRRSVGNKPSPKNLSHPPSSQPSTLSTSSQRNGLSSILDCFGAGPNDTSESSPEYLQRPPRKRKRSVSGSKAKSAISKANSQTNPPGSSSNKNGKKRKLSKPNVDLNSLSSDWSPHKDKDVPDDWQSAKSKEKCSKLISKARRSLAMTFDSVDDDKMDDDTLPDLSSDGDAHPSPHRADTIFTGVTDPAIGSGLSYQEPLKETHIRPAETSTTCGNTIFPKSAPIANINELLQRDEWQHLNLSQEEAQKLEKSTREQAYSLRWLRERRKRITASKFSLFMKRKAAITEAFLDKIFKSSYTSSSMSYGTANEGIARRMYARKQKLHVHEIGLVVNPAFPFLGASPDGVVCDGGVCGIVEVKCPYSAQNLSITDACKQVKNFCLVNDKGEIHLKKGHDYEYQIQGQLLATGAPFCDFVVYTHEDLFIQRIRPDVPLMRVILTRLERMYCDHVKPYLTETSKTSYWTKRKTSYWGKRSKTSYW